MPNVHSVCLLAGIEQIGRPGKRLKADRFDDREYTTIPVTTNGRPSYPTMHRRTKDDDVARRRLTDLGGVDDSEEARRRTNYLASASIAQDEATSVVYGMPKAASETGCIDRVALVGRIPHAISETVRQVGVACG